MDRGPTADALDDEGDLASDFLEIAVGNPVTVGSGLLNKHTNYTVTVKVRGRPASRRGAPPASPADAGRPGPWSQPACQTSYVQFKAREFSVQRRYRDFVWLYRKLQHAYRDVAFPVLPPGKFAGRFKAQFLQDRMNGLDDFLNWYVSVPRRRGDRGQASWRSAAWGRGGLGGQGGAASPH